MVQQEPVKELRETPLPALARPVKEVLRAVTLRFLRDRRPLFQLLE